MYSSKGSEWRKWDLHLHTPFTKLENRFPVEDPGEVWKNYCTFLENSDVEVFGITDYFSVDNYFTFKEKNRHFFPSSKKVFFPNIEFRLDVSVGKSAKEVNIHVLFSDTLSQEILKRFLTKLNTNHTSNGVVISCDQLKSEADYKSASVSLNDLIDTLEECFGGNKCYVIIAAANNDGIRPDGDAPRKVAVSHEIDKRCHGVFGNTGNVEYFLSKVRYGHKEASVPIPVFCGSDAHSFKHLEDYLGKQFIRMDGDVPIVEKNVMWVKAESTFRGLLQIFNEPSRVYLGEKPQVLRRVADNPTKYIKSISVNKTSPTGISDVWFDNLSIDLNPELVAIIGNKGKGKSALSDIIGLCANAHINDEDFSFLTKDRFKNPKNNLARNFVGVIDWEGGSPMLKNLNDNPDLDSPERVKYIPQNFLEKLCNKVDKEMFEKEMEDVIFLRMEDHMKVGKASLQEVLTEKLSTIHSEIAQIKLNVSLCNVKIIELETKGSVAFGKANEEALMSKKNELSVHLDSKPSVVKPPEEREGFDARANGISTKIDGYRKAIQTLQLEKTTLEAERNVLDFEIADLNLIKTEAGKVSLSALRFKEANGALASKYNLDLDEVLKVTTIFDEIDAQLLSKNQRTDEIKLRVSPENPENILAKIELYATEIQNLQRSLDGESLEYQQYLTDLERWEMKRASIEGDSGQAGTVKYHESVKEYLLNDLSKDLSALKKTREELVMDLLKLKQNEAAVYKDLYKPVTDFIDANKSALSTYAVNIDVELELNEFENKFFNFISNNISGSFYGTSDSRNMLRGITEIRDFNNPEQVIDWLNDIIDHLQNDRRNNQVGDLKREIGSQIKSGFNVKDFYDFLFSLDYYVPSYQLKLGKKILSELSPGERGALLLIFYLLLDNRDIPIIIDQPEENLDNQSVFNILVHFVKLAKQRRQIILVTHNPNLAVVCDAEQIIRMDIAKDKKNKVSFITGGIENSSVNEAIVDILEGTRPAFDNRTSKYDIGYN